MKIFVLWVVLVGMCCQAFADSGGSKDGSLYAYSKSGNSPLFLTNIKNEQTNREKVIIHVPTVNKNELPTAPITVPTSNGVKDVQLVSEDSISEETHGDYDKRWVQYNQWQYFKTENEFDDKSFKMANLVSNDENAILSVGYDSKDKSHQKPIVAIILSSDVDDNGWHKFLCTENCLNIDLNVDGKKYPKISMAYGGKNSLVAKKPSTFINYIKNGETIKIRLRSVTGDYLIYEFEPETTLNLKELKSL